MYLCIYLCIFIYIYIYIHMYIYIYIYIHIICCAPMHSLKGRILSRLPAPIKITSAPTVSCHNFRSLNFKLSVSNPKSKYVAYLSVLSQISNCQSLGRKNKHDILKTDRTSEFRDVVFDTPGLHNKIPGYVSHGFIYIN